MLLELWAQQTGEILFPLLPVNKSYQKKTAGEVIACRFSPLLPI